MLEVIKRLFFESFFSPFKSSWSCKHVALSAAVCLDCWSSGGGWSSTGSYQQTARGGGAVGWGFEPAEIRQRDIPLSK